MTTRHKTIAAAALAAAALVLTPLAASAEGNGRLLRPAQRLHVEPHAYAFATGADSIAPNGVVPAGWADGPDSPSDAKNARALRAVVPASTPTTGYYVIAFSDRSIARRSHAEKIRNLSFEFHNTEAFGGGAPRISVQFDNGDVAYLSAETCDNPLAVSPSWSRASFVMRKRVGCSFNVTGETGGVYASDGVNSAWDSYVALNPGQVVVSDYLVIDAQAVPGSTGGTYRVDRLALGAGKMYNRSNLYGVDCSASRAC